MAKKISKTEKDRRWLALQKNKMQERIKAGLPVFDGRLVRIPLINLQYGEKPEVEHA
jgi:hypothetical protein